MQEVPKKENWFILAESEQSHDLLQKEITERMVLEGEIGFYQVRDLEKNNQANLKEYAFTTVSERCRSVFDM